MEKDTSTEQRIIESARKVFLLKGMYGARMQDIADEAGINKALLHYYFRSKDKLFDIIFLEAAGKLILSVRDIIGNDRSLEDKITGLCNRYMGLLSENPCLPIFVLNEIHQNPERIIRMFREKETDLHLQTFFRQIQEAVDKKQIKPVSPLQLMTNIISLCVFPFAARPLFQALFNMDQWQFNLFIEERKRQVSELILGTLRPDEKW